MAITEIKKQKWMKAFTHLLVIAIIFILPDLLFRYAVHKPLIDSHHMLGVYLKTAVFVAVFYIEYFSIVPIAVFDKPHKRFLSFSLANLALLICALVLIAIIQYKYLNHPPHRRHMPDPTTWENFLTGTSFLLREAGMMVLVIGLGAAIRMGENWIVMEKKHQELLATQREDELQSLKNQLNPHFLFNTLNTIYVLIDLSPQQAQGAVHELSALLRYALYENPERVRLSQEANFARNYISLMGMRLGEDAIKADFAIENDVDVAPLLFITLIENAFKHGNTGQKDHPIEISISSTPEGVVKCRTVNHFLHRDNDRKSGGIGLANLQRRLQLIYGNAATLSTRVDGDVFTATLTIHTNPSKT